MVLAENQDWIFQRAHYARELEPAQSKTLAELQYSRELKLAASVSALSNPEMRRMFFQPRLHGMMTLYYSLLVATVLPALSQKMTRPAPDMQFLH
jgi:hypothetical protein